MPLTRPTFLLTLFLALIALVALACASSTPEPTPAPTIADDAATRAAAESALLVLSDFPEGWEAQPPDPDDDDDPDFSNAPQKCQDFYQQEHLAGTLFEITLNEFKGPDRETVDSSVTVFDSPASASAAFDEVRRLQQDCAEPIRAALLDYYETNPEELSGLTLVDFVTQKFEFPRYGEDTLTTRFLFEFERDAETITSYADSIAIRHGSLVGDFAFVNVDTPPDPELLRHLAELIAPRLASAWNTISPPSGDE
jgi:hypothetical protein